jgi:hypothetical protein
VGNNTPTKRFWHGWAPIRFAAAVGTGICTGVSLAVAIANEQFAIVAAVLPLAVMLSSLLLLLPRDWRRDIAIVLVLAFALRLTSAIVIYNASVALGMHGFTSGDDEAYSNASWYLAEYLKGTPVAGHGPPDWGGFGYLFGTYTFLASAVFALFGHQLLLMDVINATFGAALIPFTWDVTRRTFDVRSAHVAAGLTAVVPSLIVFSAINIKDALHILIVMVILWLVLRLQVRPAVITLVAIYVGLELMRGIRNHVFVGLEALTPLAVVVAPIQSVWRRFQWAAAALVVSVLLLGVNSWVTGTPWIPPQALAEIERFRTALTYGRTAIVTAPSQTPTATATSLVTATPAPETTATVQAEPDSELVTRTINYLPTGLAYALFAPFAWQATRLVDFAAIPEVIIWYAVMAGMIWTCFRRANRWRYFATPLLYVAGLLVLFALVEGNVGTLLRHRALLLPPAIVIASPAMAAAVARTQQQFLKLSNRNDRVGTSPSG